MLRSNSKKASENIRNYIIKHFDNCGYDYPEAETFEKVAHQIMFTFFEEVGKHKSWKESWFSAFTDWCSGLPSILDTCYYYNRSAVVDVAGILEETEAESSKYSEQKAEQLLTWLIYRELDKAIQKHFKCSLNNLPEV